VLFIFLVFCVVYIFALFILVLCLMPNVTCVSGLSTFAPLVFSKVYRDRSVDYFVPGLENIAKIQSWGMKITFVFPGIINLQLIDIVGLPF